MKNKLARFLMTFVLVLCLGFGLTACKKNDDDDTPEATAKVTSISVGLAESSSYTLTDNTITIEYGNKVTFLNSDFVVTATMDDSTKKILSLKSDSNPNGYTLASTIPNDNVTPLGEYKLIFGHADLTETNYKTITVKVEKANINPASLNLTWTDSSNFKYDGTEKTVTITNLPDYLQVVSYDGNTETYPNGTTAPESSTPQAKTYTATAMLKVKDDMADKYILTGDGVTNGVDELTHNWTIGKKVIAVPSTDDIMQSYTYDNTEKTAAIKSDVVTNLSSQNITAAISGATTGTNANSYQIAILFTYNGPDKAYCDLGTGDTIGSVNTVWLINQCLINTNISLTQNSLTYNGCSQSVEFDDSSLSEYSSVLSTVQSGTLSGINADTYTATITFTVNEDYSNNYTVSNATVTKEWKINPFTINTSNLSLKIKDTDIDHFIISNATAYTDSSFTYDGSEKEVVVDTSSLKNLGYTMYYYYPNNIESELQTIKLVTTTSGTFKATNVGTYTAIISFTLYDNTEENRLNYVISNPTVTLTWKIGERVTTPLTLKVNTNDADNQFTYGDAVTLTDKNVTATGLNAGDTIASLGKLSFVYSDKEDGTYTSTVPTTKGTYYVKVAEFVESNEAGVTNGFKNYQITYEAGTIKITPKQVVFTAINQTILQGEDLPTGQVEDYSKYLVGKDTIDDLGITLTFTYLSESGSTLSYNKNYDCSGTYTIHVSASFTNKNYTNIGVTNITGTLTIKKVDVYLDVAGFAKEPGINDEDQQTASPILIDRNSSGSQSLGTNQIIKGLIVKIDDKGDTSLVATAYSDDALTQAIDFKNINSWNDVGFWIVVKKGDETIFVSEYNAFSVNFITTYYVNENYSEDVTISDKLVTYTLTEAGNFAFTMPEALNSATLTQYYKTGDGSYAEGPIAVENGVNNIDYKLTIKIDDVTYTYETDLQVIVSTSAQSVLSEDAGYSATFGSMNVNDNEVETSSENYNVSNIKSLKESIDKKETTLNYDESKYDLTNQTSEIVGNTLLVTIVLTEKDTSEPEGEQSFGAGIELYAGETKTVTIILVIKFSGWVDNDTGAIINYRNEKDEFKQTIGNEITTTADVNNFRIELNNHYATWKLEAEGKTTIKKEDVGENGELKNYWSPEAGSTWKLTITATDGTTTRTITINVVEAEQTPDIKLTIDDDAQTTLCVYGFEDGEPTGDFVVSQVIDEENFKNIARFYAYLGSDYLKENQTTITISSLEFNEDGTLNEMIGMLMSMNFTWKGTNDEELDLEDFTLAINKTDPDAPYAKFYIGGKFDMSEMGNMSEYDATAEEMPEEGSGAPSGEAEILFEFYIYFCENANELEDLPDDDTSIVVQMYGASITKSNFKYNKVSNTYVGTFKNLWLYQIGESIKIERLKTSLGTADISKTFAREETPWGVGVKIKLTATTDTYIVLLFLDSDKSELDYYETNFGKLSETTFSVTIDGKTATQDNIDYRANPEKEGPTTIFIKINKKKEGLEEVEHGIKIDDISFGGKYNDGNWFLLACYSENGSNGYAITKYAKISEMGDDKWLSVYNYSHGEAAVFFIATTKTYLEENGLNENMFHSTNDTDYRWVYEICVVFSDSKGEGLEEPVHVFESKFAGKDANGNDETLRLNFKAESLTDSVTANGSAYVIQDNYCIVATVGENNEFKFTTVDGNEYITMTSFTPKTELIVFGNTAKNVIFSGSAPNCAIAYDNGYKLKVLTYTYYDNGEEKTVKYVEFYVYLSDGYNFYGYEDGYLPCYIIFADEIPQGLFLTKNEYYKVTFNDSVPSFVTLKDADIVSQLTGGGDYTTLVIGNIYDKGTVTNSTTDDKERIDVVVRYHVTAQELATLRTTDNYSLNINVSNWILIFGSVTLTDGGNSSNKVNITDACTYPITLKMQTTDTECFVSFTLTHGGDTYTFKCLFEVTSTSETEAE